MSFVSRSLHAPLNCHCVDSPAQIIAMDLRVYTCKHLVDEAHLRVKRSTIPARCESGEKARESVSGLSPQSPDILLLTTFLCLVCASSVTF